MTETPRILVTNDDGYTSEGIQVLADALEGIGEIWVVAPNREQSAVSHALTLDRPLRIERLGTRRMSVDGTPTDCVAIAMSNLMDGRGPDLVVSGINFGFNMGADVHYSGTVSAAFEGVILGLPALAVSQQLGDGYSFERAAEIACGLADDVPLKFCVPLMPVVVTPSPGVAISGFSWPSAGFHHEVYDAMASSDQFQLLPSL